MRRSPPARGETDMGQTAGFDILSSRTFFLGVAPGNAGESDFALARAAAGGAPAAVGELYARHSRRVYTLCLRMTHNPADAEDLTQEVFILLSRKIGSFRGESQFTTWLHRLTINHVLMHFRRGSTRLAESPEDVEAESVAANTRRYSAQPQVLDYIALDAAMSLLPPGYRSVFVLYDVEGYTHEEVAGIRGCSVGTSKSQLHKARTRLRRLLNSDGPRRG